jgi:hypothetical protein
MPGLLGLAWWRPLFSKKNTAGRGLRLANNEESFGIMKTTAVLGKPNVPSCG